MINPAGRCHNAASADRIVSNENKAQSSKFQAFGAELSEQLGHGKVSNRPVSSLPAHLPAGQKPVTWRQNPDAGTGSTSTTTSTATGSKPAITTATTQQAPQSFDDAYWAKQPPAVQELRNIQSQSQRTQLATQLANEGYSIDVPIMVWGWDPQITTQLRQSMGYTWVPSALQQNVAVAPGITQGGQTPYDPAHPPAGSIMV